MRIPAAINIPREFLLECFRFDPNTGDLIWKERQSGHFRSIGRLLWWNAKFSGKIAGTKKFERKGEPSAIMISMAFNKKTITLSAHKIILTMHGIEIPNNMEVDHMDRNPHNNKLNNLRVCMRKFNMANRKCYRKLNLPKGVNIIGSGRFSASLGRNGKTVHIGTFNTSDQAYEAYKSEAVKEFGEFACI